MFIFIQIIFFSFAHHLGAKNFSNLQEMAKCHLQYELSVFNGYGCWCAVNNGTQPPEKPIDGIDDCCVRHEKCYANSSCKNVLQKFLYYPYNWTCDGMSYKVYEKIRNEKVYVALPENRPTIKCTSVNVGCKRDMCHCDKAFVECLAKYEKPKCKRICPTTKSVHKQIGNVQKKVSILLWLKIGESQTEQLDICEDQFGEDDTEGLGIRELFNGN